MVYRTPGEHRPPAAARPAFPRIYCGAMLSPAESDALVLSLSVAARRVVFNLPFPILVA